MNEDLEHYRNPGGWVEFWIGVIALLAASGLVGRICYLEESVRKGDAEYKQKILDEAKTTEKP